MLLERIEKLQTPAKDFLKPLVESCIDEMLEEVYFPDSEVHTQLRSKGGKTKGSDIIRRRERFAQKSRAKQERESRNREIVANRSVRVERYSVDCNNIAYQPNEAALYEAQVRFAKFLYEEGLIEF